ncbi:MAG TPA: riboflavin synthase [Algoriphagus sp.]|jgi:riboflavin synthase|uniref:riboflavin synthase n=1 Tax=unclassified Algoriphagus TaxID=2641541 RepID=UPI000C654FD0|nr:MULTISPECIES: riboflavin synthase [unclassified Algoriphagus]MAL11905.1 riboflavin synthase [Algoriphagus sp.]QYH38677.1 riboflavin synthase [Algoriphagus sp. NBT04N3]HAD52393.1 riboflavin synthase [Algoriphagus sp.]HAH35648.1 riboflavin synthase [Algoriphagus sp.]HAS57735.1 riboflavin synthase [Algoriphagus sp.]|tara:strand:+ start:748 stop:1344 length:597 start_codon:yes stop_codon:yes gene_type:complete
MFTGIIESFGVIQNITKEGSNVHFDLESEICSELKIDQSVAHDGVCLTVVRTDPKAYRVTAIDETIQKTNLAAWKVGKKVNLERCMPANGRFDGHIVQGHVDQTGVVKNIKDQDGSWVFDLEFDPATGNVTVEKGSITINGTSLTCFNSGPGRFSVAIIPYTYEHTNFHQLEIGDFVNLEFDIVGKYIQRILRGYPNP